MTITDAIKQLERLRLKHLIEDGDIEVYFDCPKCGQSFTPNRVVGVAVHLTEQKAEPDR